MSIVGFLRLACISLSVLAASSSSYASQSSTPPSQVTISDIVSARMISDLSLSPDKKFLAFQVFQQDVASNTRPTEWWVLPLAEGGRPRKIADGGESFGPDGAHYEAPTWSTDSRRLYYRKLSHGQLQVWFSDIDGSNSAQMTHDGADISTYSGEGKSYILDDRNHRLFYEVGASRQQILDAEDAEDRDGVHIDPLAELDTPLVHNEWYNGRYATIRRDLAHEMYGLRADVPMTVKVVDLKSRQTHVADQLELAAYQRLKSNETPFSTPDTLWGIFWSYSSDQGKIAELVFKKVQVNVAIQTVAWMPAGDRSKRIECSDPRCTGGHMRSVSWWDHDRQILFISQDADGFTDLNSWDVVSGQVRRLLHTTEVVASPGVPGLTGSSAVYGGCPIVGDHAYCPISDSNQPPRLVDLNLKTGARITLFDPNERLRALTTAIHIEHLYWTDQFGRKFHGVLVPAVNTAPSRYPLVITSYGCEGFLQGAGGGEMPEFALAEHGIGALCIRADAFVIQAAYPNGKFRQGEEAAMQTTLDSWEAAVRYLISRGAIDPKRIGVSGHSFGDKAVWYALSHSSLFSVAINNGGSDDDPVSYYTGGPGSVTRWGNNDWMKLPAPNDDPAHLWARISGALNADKIVAPVLIQVSDTEYDEIPDIYVSMLDAKKPVDLYVFTGEGHQFRQPHHRVIRAERNLEWFRFWFDHFEDSAPAKKDQYRYWETLCVKQLSAYPDRKLRCVRP